MKAFFFRTKTLALWAGFFMASPAWATTGSVPACAAASQVVAWNGGVEGPILLADVDGAPLHGRRVWIDAEARNDGNAPLRLPLLLAFDLQANGSMAFGQSGELFVPPHSSGHLSISAWVDPGVRRIAVQATSATRKDANETTLRLRCSKSTATFGAKSQQQPLLDEALDLYFDNAVHMRADPARLRQLAQG